MTERQFERGERVVRVTWPRNQAGEVISCARKTAVVQFDGDVRERVNLEHLRPETPEDVANREHSADMDACHASRPRTHVVSVEYDSRWGGAHDPIGATLHGCRTPDDMRLAAVELTLIAAWFAARPQAPTTKDTR